MSLENLSPQARDELALLAKQMSDDPDVRPHFLAYAKKVRPELVIPEIEMRSQAEKAFEQRDKEIREIKAQLAEKEAMEEVQRRRQDIVRKGKVREEEIAEVEKVMVEKKIADHDTAADYMRWMKQMAEPTPGSTYGGQPVMNKFDLKNYFKNPVNAARNEAVAALNELRKNPKAVGF